jgi:hypothetical protein
MGRFMAPGIWPEAYSDVERTSMSWAGEEVAPRNSEMEIVETTAFHLYKGRGAAPEKGFKGNKTRHESL